MEELKQLIKSLGLEMSVLSAPSNPSMPEDMFHWVCCISRGASIMNTSFSTGGGRLQLRKKPLAFRPFAGRTANDITNARKELGSVYYDFKQGRMRRYHKATSDFHSELFFDLFEAAPPTIEDVLSSLAMESSVLDYPTFEEWARDFGYDEDSRSGEKTYKACLENTLRFRNFLGEENLRKIQGMEL